MQDFANYRNTNDLKASEVHSTEWTPDIPSVIMGILIGIFVAIIGFKVSEYLATQIVPIEAPMVEQIEDTPLVLDFYEALKVYEVLPRRLKD
tara:strand:+ start:176 stop:451 length:276 start_codon:yes stop_codon:yes gene_type:complete